MWHRLSKLQTNEDFFIDGNNFCICASEDLNSDTRQLLSWNIHDTHLCSEKVEWQVYGNCYWFNRSIICLRFFFFLFCKRQGRSLMHVSPSLLLFCDNKHGLVLMTTMWLVDNFRMQRRNCAKLRRLFWLKISNWKGNWWHLNYYPPKKQKQKQKTPPRVGLVILDKHFVCLISKHCTVVASQNEIHAGLLDHS